MSWSYDSAQLQTSLLYQIRFKMGDTDEDSPIFEDEELQFLIVQYGPSMNNILYQVVLSAINRLSATPDYTLGPYSEDGGNRVASLQTMLETLSRKLKASEGVKMKPPTTAPKFIYDIMSIKQ